MKNILQLTLTLAISLIAFGAQAQADDTQSVGSTHTFKVNEGEAGHTGNTYTWNVMLADANSPSETAAAAANFAFIGLSTGVDLNTVKIQWLNIGNYIVQIEETNEGVNSCSTFREITIEVTAGELDLYMFASLEDSTSITGADLVSCNASAGALIARGTDEFGTSERFFTFEMKTDGQDWKKTWGFNYTIEEANGSGALTTAVVTAVTAGATVVGDLVTVAENTTKIVLRVTFKNTPGPSDDTHPDAAANANIILNMIATAGTPYINTSATIIIKEDVSKNANNTLATPYTITASPKTTDITFD